MMIISLHKYLYFSTEVHPRLLLVAIFKYSDNTQERGIKPKKVTLSLKNVIFGLVCRDYVSEISQYIRIFHIVEFSNHSPTVAWHCGSISCRINARKSITEVRGRMQNFVQAKRELNAIFGDLTKYLEVRSEFSADYRIADEDERDIDKFSSEVRVLNIAQMDTTIKNWY